jgi:hypothetical protein
VTAAAITATTLDFNGAADFSSTLLAAGAVTLGANGTTPAHRINAANTASATGGAATVSGSGQPQGFITININGTSRKIPYFAT